MKRKLLMMASIVILAMPVVYGQEEKIKDTITDYKTSELAKANFTNKISSIQGNSAPLRSDLSLDLSKDFAASLKLNFLIKRTNLSLILQDDIGSTNEYTPMLDKGSWALDNSFGMNLKFYAYKYRSVFKKDFVQFQALNETMDSSSIYDALDKSDMLSRYSTLWFTMGLRHNYQTLLTLKDSLHSLMDDPFNTRREHSLLIPLFLHGLHVFSYRHGWQVSGNIGYTLQLNGNNYESLDKVNVYNGTFVTDSLNNYTLSLMNESKGRAGELKLSNAQIVSGEVHFTYIPPETNFSFDLFASPSMKFIGSDEILNLRTGVNVGVTKEDKSKVNIAIVIDFKNMTQPYKDMNDRRSRMVFGLLLGVPIGDLGGK